ncbi:hypothetical protein ACQ4PT_053594 [Festuca glaucescens]
MSSVGGGGCDACGALTHRRNHCAASPCSRCGGAGHFEALCTSPAGFDATDGGAARCGVCGGAGHGDSNCATTETAGIRCETCGELGHQPRDCPTRTGDLDDPNVASMGSDACASCGQPGHLAPACPCFSVDWSGL